MLFRSTSISVALHAAVLMMIAMAPWLPRDRFETTGRQSVISLEASVARPVHATSISVAIPLVTQTVRTDITAEPSPDRPFEHQRQDHPRTKMVTLDHPIPEFRSDTVASYAHRVASATAMPTVADTTTPRPRQSIAAQVPAATVVPIEQMVGTSKKIPPDFSANPPPQYPAEAARRGVQGTVTLRLHVDATGRVDQVVVVNSSGHRSLDHAAMKAVQQWKGQPAKQFGRAIATVEVLPIKFRL